MLPLELDVSRCVKGDSVSNSPLDFRQFSFTLIIQVLGVPTLVNGFPVPPFTDMLWSRLGFPPGQSVDLTGLSSTCGTLVLSAAPSYGAHILEINFPDLHRAWSGDGFMLGLLGSYDTLMSLQDLPNGAARAG